MRAIYKTVIYEVTDISLVDKEVLKQQRTGWDIVQKLDVIPSMPNKPMRITILYQAAKGDVGIVCLSKRSFNEHVRRNGRSHENYICIEKINDLRGRFFTRIETTYEEGHNAELVGEARTRIRD